MEQRPARRASLPRLVSNIRINPMVSDIEILAQKKGTNTSEERFKVKPDYAYPNTRMNREELRREMNKKSSFYHSLRLPSQPEGVGQVALEILQCFGLPKPDSTLGSEASAFCIAVCGSHAFRTDTMPPVANPIWLRHMRRACIFPIFHAYARVYVGVFGISETRRDGFAGRIVLDVARLRPGCTYDVTLPLRRSAHVYSREQRGAIRVRVHLQYFSEKKAILSYLPQSVPRFTPNEEVAVNCCDVKSFQNVARVVHGEHMPGRFSTKQLQATLREINMTQITVLRYIRKREFRNLTQWRVPLISAFVFGAWMHCIYTDSVTYIPGHFLTLLLLYLWKNYAFYRLDAAMQNGFLAPSWEEMFLALVFGRPNSIAPLEMEATGKGKKSAIDDMYAASTEDEAPATSDDEGMGPHGDLAKVFRSEIRLHTARHHLRTFRHVFRGSEAVVFLMLRGYASTREEAVELAEKLRTEARLFEDVQLTNRPFKDDKKALYHLVDSDPSKYKIKTHTPWGKGFFRFLGLLPESPPTFTESQLEMPFARGIEHPRLTVKESVVIRSKESMKMLEDEQGTAKNDKSNSKQLAEGLNALLNDQDNKSEGGKTMETEPRLDEDPDVTVTILNKPPQQDIDFKPKKSGKTLPEVLAEARHKLHGYLMHAFNDRVYPYSTFGIQAHEAPNRRTRRARRLLSLSRCSPFRAFSKRSVSNNSMDTQKSDKAARTIDKKALQDELDELDKLLHIGKYSNPNPWISRIGVIVQPIVEMVLEFLCLFRALFNIFTWRDPILTFWVSVLGPVVVIILHCFPWRIVMGIAGLALFGPQNYFLRVYRERKFGPDEFDPDRKVRKKKPPPETDPGEVPLFSMEAPDNNPIPNEAIDDSNVRKVVVPYSQLMYQRFYDFPPETEYARVVKDDPPTQVQLDAAQFTRQSSFASASQASSSSGTLRRRRPLRRGGRRPRRADTLSSEDTFNN